MRNIFHRERPTPDPSKVIDAINDANELRHISPLLWALRPGSLLADAPFARTVVEGLDISKLVQKMLDEKNIAELQLFDCVIGVYMPELCARVILELWRQKQFGDLGLFVTALTEGVPSFEAFIKSQNAAAEPISKADSHWLKVLSESSSWNDADGLNAWLRSNVPGFEAFQESQEERQQ